MEKYTLLRMAARWHYADSSTFEAADDHAAKQIALQRVDGQAYMLYPESTGGTGGTGGTIAWYVNGVQYDNPMDFTRAHYWLYSGTLNSEVDPLSLIYQPTT